MIRESYTVARLPRITAFDDRPARAELRGMTTTADLPVVMVGGQRPLSIDWYRSHNDISRGTEGKQREQSRIRFDRRRT